MPDPIQIVILEGDQTGQELLEQAVRVLDPKLLDLEIEFQRFDLSLQNRRTTSNEVVTAAAEAMRSAGVLANIRRNTSSSAAGTSTRPARRDGIPASRCFIRTAIGVGPL